MPWKDQLHNKPVMQIEVILTFITHHIEIDFIKYISVLEGMDVMKSFTFS